MASFVDASILEHFSPQGQERLAEILSDADMHPQLKWHCLVSELLHPQTVPFHAHYELYRTVYEDLEDYEAPAWFPTGHTVISTHRSAARSRTGSSNAPSAAASTAPAASTTSTTVITKSHPLHTRPTNIQQIMSARGMTTYQQFYDWSIDESTCAQYWDCCIRERLKVPFHTPYCKVFDFSATDPSVPAGEADPFFGLKSVRYLQGAMFNVADTCFPAEYMTPAAEADPATPAAIVFASDADATLVRWSHRHLHRLTTRIALALTAPNSVTGRPMVSPGDSVGICMPMSPESVAIYLAIVRAGGAVVSIADSFSAIEIATRMRLAGAKVIFTQDVIGRGDKILPLYTRVLDAEPERVVVVPYDARSGLLNASITLRQRTAAAADTTELTDSRTGQRAHYVDVGLNDLMPADDASNAAAIEGYRSVVVPSEHVCNILFSSGTTGEPKAIPWAHCTPLKSAIDGHIHQDIQAGDVVCWPTNLGWMMGPWILFQMANRATLALYNGVSTTLGFMQFVQNAGVGMLGVVPSIVKAWKSLIDKQQQLRVQKYNQQVEAARQARHTAELAAQSGTEAAAADTAAVTDPVPPPSYYWPFDWSCVTRFASTGEASDTESMLWLMSRVPSISSGGSAAGSGERNTLARTAGASGYAPVIEYCGGTEIAGSFLSSTLLQPNIPSLFSTPVCGSRVCILSDDGAVLYDDRSIGQRVLAAQASLHPASSAYGQDGNCKDTRVITGEIALIPPSLGLSTRLLNRDHHECYYHDMPLATAADGTTKRLLRRHGDEVQNLPGSYYRALGRCDDTMNLGGIKVSSVEIERVCNVCCPEIITETAAIAIRPKDGGPSQLVMVVMTKPGSSGITLDNNTTGASLAAEEFAFKMKVRAACQGAIKSKLNPLFHIADVVLVDALPRTASNKIMRRVLRDNYVDARDGRGRSRSRSGSNSAK